MYLQYKGNICNRAQYCGSELPEYMALILRNGGSQSPDRWLREPRNNHIILGHLGESNINRIVFTFHVPIFFLITGYFINSNSSIRNFVKNKVKTLIVPYIITSLVIIIIATLQGLLIGDVKEVFLEWLYAAIYGAGGDYTEPFYIKGIGALWFLWATFWGSLFLKISLKFKKWSRMSVIVGLFILGYELKKLFWFPLSI